MTAAQITERARWRARDSAQEGVHQSGRFAALLDRVRIWRRRACERAMLAGMSDQLLRDIGITRCDAMNEADKPFWRE